MRHYLPGTGHPTIIGIEGLLDRLHDAIAGSRRGVRTIKVNNDKARSSGHGPCGKRDILGRDCASLLSGSGSLAGFCRAEYVLLRYDGLASARQFDASLAAWVKVELAFRG